MADTQPQPLEAAKKELMVQVAEDIEVALKTLLQILSSESEEFKSVTNLLGQYNTAHKAYLELGEKVDTVVNRIRAAVIELIDRLKEADITVPGPAPGTAAVVEAAPRTGNILYRIPNTMAKGEMTKCVIRIALTEADVEKDIERDKHVKVKALDRVSDTMKAEILDPTKGKNFDISPISDEVQLIPETGYTEWWFYVTPLAEKGNYPLVLKVSIIQMVDGEPKIQNIPMEEVVQVVVDAPVEEVGEEQPMKAAAVALNMQTASLAGLGLITGLKQSASASAQAGQAAAPAQPAAAVAKFSLLQKVAVALLVAGAGTTAAWFLTPETTRDWWNTRYVVDSPEGYTNFMEKYPESQYYDPAACRKTELLNTPEAYRLYLYEHSEGSCRSAAEQALERLEDEALVALEQAPSKANLDAFLINFPECYSLERLYQVVEKNEQLRTNYLPMIMQRWKECKRLDPNFAPLPDINLLPVIDTIRKPTDTTVQQSAPAPTEEKPGRTQTAPQQPPGSATPSNTNVSTPTATPTTAPPPAPKMIRVSGGTFQMGAADGNPDETPHEVTLSSFSIGQYEVTFEEYLLFCEATGHSVPDDKGFGRGKNPVIGVSWLDAVAYCNWLSEALGLKPVYAIAGAQVSLVRGANGYRLPTEAEWEYAAKGGSGGKAFAYSGSDTPREVGWYSQNALNKTHPVGHLSPNELIIHDMSGNVREWCYDRYTPYSSDAANNPTGPSRGGAERIYRGGCWGRNEGQMKVTFRGYAPPQIKDFWTGFRLAQ